MHPSSIPQTWALHSPFPLPGDPAPDLVLSVSPSHHGASRASLCLIHLLFPSASLSQHLTLCRCRVLVVE